MFADELERSYNLSLSSKRRPSLAEPTQDDDEADISGVRDLFDAHPSLIEKVRFDMSVSGALSRMSSGE